MAPTIRPSPGMLLVVELVSVAVVNVNPVGTRMKRRLRSSSLRSSEVRGFGGVVMKARDRELYGRAMVLCSGVYIAPA